MLVRARSRKNRQKTSRDIEVEAVSVEILLGQNRHDVADETDAWRVRMVLPGPAQAGDAEVSSSGIIAQAVGILNKHDFIEVRPPSSENPPEVQGYLVPSPSIRAGSMPWPGHRVHKQLLMIAGLGYYQIVKCFRDEFSVPTGRWNSAD